MLTKTHATVPPDPLLTEAQAAEFLDLQPGTLQTWRSTGRYSLPFVKVGRLIRYRSSALEAWIKARERGAA